MTLPPVILSSPNAPVADFTPTVSGTYVFMFYVDDGNDRSIGQEVTVTVGPADPNAPGTIGGSESGGCFIATAAWGMPLDSEVTVLRRFRDRALLPTETGRTMIGFYYRHSPPLARAISRDEKLKRFVQTLLAPMVRVLDITMRPERGDGQ